MRCSVAGAGRSLFQRSGSASTLGAAAKSDHSLDLDLDDQELSRAGRQNSIHIASRELWQQFKQTCNNRRGSKGEISDLDWSTDQQFNDQWSVPLIEPQAVPEAALYHSFV